MVSDLYTSYTLLTKTVRMNIIVKILLFTISIMSIYIIGGVGLEILPKISASSNAENINNVSLNLSYSYFAGLIFYFFISYLPKYIEGKKIKPTLKLKVEDLNNQIESYIHTFNEKTVDGIIKTITELEIKSLYNSHSLLDKSYYADLTGGNMSNVDFINSTKMNIVKYIDGILFYKDYLNSEQILALEKIKESKFFHLFKIQEYNQARILYNHKNFKDECAKEFYELIKTLKKIQI